MDDLALDFERNIGTPVAQTMSFSIGALKVEKAKGWLKVTLNERDLDCLAELLPPDKAQQFLEWLKSAG